MSAKLLYVKRNIFGDTYCNSEPLIRALKVSAKGLKGKEDYIGEPAHFETQIVKGGHISPLEAPEEVYDFVREILEK